MLSRRAGIGPAILALPLAVAACGSPADRVSATLVRDSAGIEIVESTAARWPGDRRWQVVAEPELTIGVVEGQPEYLFSNIEGALLLDDGRIAVADRGSSQVRFYARDGTYLGFVGGPGDGPGELGYIRGMGRCGADSLFVFEIDYLNIVYTADGRFAREARPYDRNSMDRRPYTLRCARNGYYAAVGWEDLSGPPAVGFYRAIAPAWVLAPDRAASASAVQRIPQAGLVVSTELGSVLSSERIGTAGGSRPHPFGRAVTFALTEDAIYLGTGEAYEIRRYALDGRLERIIRWPGGDLTITDPEIAAYHAARLEAVDPRARPALERSLAEMPMPPAFPAFDRLETDPDGNVWIASFRRPTSSQQSWTVIGPHGALLGTVAVPSDLVITDIGRDVVLGIATDELGVERIRLHTLRKPESE